VNYKIILLKIILKKAKGQPKNSTKYLQTINLVRGLYPEYAQNAHNHIKKTKKLVVKQLEQTFLPKNHTNDQ
jgi:hypothetical protein